MRPTVKPGQQPLSAIITSKSRHNVVGPKQGGSQPPVAPQWTSTPAPPDGEANVPYSYNLSPHLNTTKGVVITVASGTLPAGLQITGFSITGTPTTAGTQAGITLTATNSSGADTCAAFSITIGAGQVTIPAARLDDPVNGSQALFDAGTETGAVALDRNLIGDYTFERGHITRDFEADADGVWRDTGFMYAVEKWGNPITITNITKGNPARVSFTGTLVRNNDSSPPGYTLGEITSGMTELSGRLIRPKNISSTTNGSFDAYQDGDDQGYNPDQTSINGNTPVNSNGYGTFTGSVQAQAYREIDNSVKPYYWDGNDTEYPHHGCKAGTYQPPPTINGDALPVNPQTGTHFFAGNIDYWIDHTRKSNGTPGWNNSKNKPRWQLMCGKVKLPPYDDNWVACSLLLPSNFDNTTTTITQERSTNALFELQDDPSTQQGNLFEIGLSNLGGGPGMNWSVKVMINTWNSPSASSFIDLGAVSSDIGLWTTFIVNIKVSQSNGYIRIYKSTGPYTSGTERAMTQVYDFSGQVGFPPTFATGWDPGIKMYKYAWHHFNNTGAPMGYPNQGVPGNQWIGYDNFRWGSQQRDGTTYQDVHPHSASNPP